MNCKLLLKILVLSSFATISTTSYSSTLTCYAVDNLAKLGFHNAAASLTCSSKRKRARFSANGAAAGSPPQKLVQAGLLSIKNQKIFDNLTPSKVEELAAAILAANRTKNVPDKIKEKLLDNSDAIKECFEDFYVAVKEERKESYKTFTSDTVNCTVNSTSLIEITVADSIDTVYLKSDEPTISISVADEDGAINTLAVTAGYVTDNCQ